MEQARTARKGIMAQNASESREQNCEGVKALGIMPFVCVLVFPMGGGGGGIRRSRDTDSLT